MLPFSYTLGRHAEDGYYMNLYTCIVHDWQLRLRVFGYYSVPVYPRSSRVARVPGYPCTQVSNTYRLTEVVMKKNGQHFGQPHLAGILNSDKLRAFKDPVDS